MKLPKILLACLVAFGVLFSGASAFAAPVFTGVFPNNANLFQFQVSSNLTFTTTNTANITNITVQLTGNRMPGVTVPAALKILGNSSLNLSGLNSTTVSGSCLLTSNLLYTVTITATDANGVSGSTNFSFNTIVPIYTWEAEDYDYSNGMYIDNPQTNAYAGFTGFGQQDCTNNHTALQNSAYRPNPTNAVNGVIPLGSPAGMGNENCGDIVRLSHLGFQDYDIGYPVTSSWAHYTRHYPAGTFFVFGRSAVNSATASTRAYDLQVDFGTAVLSTATNTTGTRASFNSPGTSNNQIYNWAALRTNGASGGLVTFASDGTASQLRVTTDTGGANMNFYMLMPTNINYAQPTDIAFANIYPDGIYQREKTNTLVFTVNSTVGIDTNSVVVQVTSTNLFGNVITSKLVSPANGLTTSGTANSLNVSMLLTTDTVYSVMFEATDLNGGQATTNITFDTVNPNYYTWEAEDYNYQSGQFFDNPQTNAYYDYTPGGTFAFDCTPTVDAFYNGTGPHLDNRQFGLSTEAASDLLRGQYQVVDPRTGVNYLDFDCGFASGGSWANYTRTFPVGVYNIYVRGASGGGANADSISVGQVSGDRTSTSQTNNIMGTFAGVATGNYQKWVWVPARNAGNTILQWTSTGLNTLRMTTDLGTMNAGYYMLVPADLTIHNPPFVTSFTPANNQIFTLTTNLTFVANSQIGVSATNVVLTVNGNIVNNLTTSGSPNALNVSYPVQSNNFYTVIVKLTDAYGSTLLTNKFDTFDTNSTYAWESEDYDFTNGQFLNNPQTVPGAYAGIAGVAEVDDHWTTHGGAYRPSSGGNDGANFEQNNVGTPVRPAFANFNYDIGNNNGGNWKNYTRVFPAGVWNIWMRVGGTGTSASAATFAQVTAGQGTTSQTLSTIGILNFASTGSFTVYTWVPITSGGNKVVWVSDGISTNTFRLTVGGGGYNEDFYLLVPANTNLPSITGVYPDGKLQFQQTNALSFNAKSIFGINSNTIAVTLNGAKVTTNLVITGVSTNWQVSYSGLKANTTYTVTIAFTDLNGSFFNTTYSFDTFANSNYQWEAEDWDYTSNGVSGLFIDNPQTNGYRNLPSTAEIDVQQSNTNALINPYNYRVYDGVNLTPSQEASGDVPRSQFGTNTDYKIDFFEFGSWANYTRHYPAGSYTVVGRFNEGGANTMATLGKVTAGYGTSSQTVTPLGTFFIPLGGWTTPQSTYLTDNNTNKVVLTFDGSQQTLQLGGNPVQAGDPTINAGYFMLVPATVASPFMLTATVSGTNVVVSFPTQNGINYQLRYKNNLTDTNWTTIGGLISGNGAVQSVSNSLTANSQRFYQGFGVSQ